MKKFLLVFLALLFATFVLSFSMFRSASVSYDFADSDQIQAQNVLGDEDVKVDYILPYPGRVLTDSVFWPLKALRDKIWILATTNNTRKAELKLLFADKRIGMAKILFEEGKTEIAYTTLTKAEKYLEEARLMEESSRKEGRETGDLLEKLAQASLKHYEIMEHIKSNSSEELEPLIINLESYAKNTYEYSRNASLEKEITPPENPFDW